MPLALERWQQTVNATTETFAIPSGSFGERFGAVHADLNRT